MICQKCGASNKDQAKFCVSCGTPLHTPPGAPQQPLRVSIPPAAAPVAASASSAPTPVSGRKLPWLWIALGGIGLLSVCVVAVIGVILVSRGSATDSIAFIVREDIDQDLGVYLMESNGEDAHLLIPVDEDDYLTSFQWSPNGRQLAYLVYEESDRSSLWIADSDSGDTEQAIRNVGTLFSFFDVPFSWSPDGRRIAYSTAEEDLEDIEISIFDLGDNDQTVIADGFLPIWSPNGNYIAFTRLDEDQEYASAYYIRPDGSRETLLAEERRTSFIPVGWSPDSRWILMLTSDDEFDSSDILLVSMDGDDQISLSDSGSNWNLSPRFSPNERWVAYLSCDQYDQSDCEIYIVRPNGEDARRLNSDTMLPYISWSPDSRSLIYGTIDGEIVSVDVNTGTDTSLTPEISGLAMPSFAP